MRGVNCIEPYREVYVVNQVIRFAWQALAHHFGQDDLTDLSSSRRRFAPHLLPDLQCVIEEQLAPLSPRLLGVHQHHEFYAPKLSDLVISEGQHVVALTPLQYQDIDVGRDETFSSLHSGLWLARIEGRPLAILLSQFMEPRGGRVVQVEIGYADILFIAKALKGLGGLMVADNRQMRLVPVQGENPWCNDNFDIWRQLELQFGIRSNTAYPGNWGADPSKIMIRCYMKTTNQ